MLLLNVSDECKRGTKDTKGTVKLINLKQTTPLRKMKKTNRQTIVHMRKHRKLKNKQHEPHQKTRSDLRCSGRVSRSCSTCGTHQNYSSLHL